MQYIISSHTESTNGSYRTNIFAGENIFAAIAPDHKQSRLNAVKLAMLLAIQESEKIRRSDITKRWAERKNYRLSLI